MGLIVAHSALTFNYTYDATAGQGVDIYIVGEFYFGHSVMLTDSWTFNPQTLVSYK